MVPNLFFRFGAGGLEDLDYFWPAGFDGFCVDFNLQVTGDYPDDELNLAPLRGGRVQGSLPLVVAGVYLGFILQ